MAHHYVGWLLSKSDRTRLLKIIPPVYHDVIAHHVTLAFGVSANAELPTETTGKIIGIADDGAGVQALVLSIGGSTRRPDGSTYHITWSIDRSAGRKPADSNIVIKKQGYKTFDNVYMVQLEPKLFG